MLSVLLRFVYSESPFDIFSIYLLPKNGDIYLELEIIMFVGDQLSLVVRRVSNIDILLHVSIIILLILFVYINVIAIKILFP